MIPKSFDNLLANRLGKGLRALNETCSAPNLIKANVSFDYLYSHVSYHALVRQEKAVEFELKFEVGGHLTEEQNIVEGHVCIVPV